MLDEKLQQMDISVPDTVGRIDIPLVFARWSRTRRQVESVTPRRAWQQHLLAVDTVDAYFAEKCVEISPARDQLDPDEITRRGLSVLGSALAQS